MKLIDISILTNINGLGSVNIIKILNYCKSNNINNIYELKNIDLSKVVSGKLANTIEMYLDTDIDNLYKNMKNLIDDYKKNDIFCICIVNSPIKFMFKFIKKGAEAPFFKFEELSLVDALVVLSINLGSSLLYQILSQQLRCNLQLDLLKQLLRFEHVVAYQF